MTKTMRAAVVDALGQPLQIRELPIPEPGPGEVLIRIAASGVCHTDLSVMDGEWLMKRPRFPLVPGHEATGYVAGVGSGVTSHKEGDRVGAFWLSSACGSCEDCSSDHESLCLRQEGLGYDRNGTYAEYCVVSAGFAVPLPPGPLEKLAPVMCAGVTSYRGLKEMRLRPGSWVVVFGVGGTGHLGIQYARAMGHRVIAIDIEADKVADATALGAELAIHCEREFPVNKIVRHTGGGAHGVLATAPAAKALEQSVRMLRRGGTCILIGIPKEPLPLNVFDMVIKGLNVRGSLIGSRNDLREALQLVSEAKVTPIVEHRPLDEVNEAVGAMRRRQVKGRVVLRMV
jgi:propanol-preferring alcohol dehydrogenase